MAERYKRLFALEHARYADGAPLLICAGALLDDRLGHSMLAQLKFKNISEEIITAVRLHIEPFDAAGKALEPVEYMYQNLHIARDEEFGQKIAVVIPDSRVSYFVPRVLQVIFKEHSPWEGADSVWSDVKSPKTLTDAYGDEELSTQYAIRYGDDCTFLPQEDRGLWFCACGLINHMDESKCHGCRRVYSALKAVNISSLRSESMQRQELERQIEVEDKAEQMEKRKKAIRLSFFLIPLLILVVLLMATVPKYMAQKKAYENAQALLSAGRYEMAQKAFIELGGYLDSIDQAQYNVPYEKAMYIMECAKNDNIDGLLLLGKKRSELAEGETVSVALYKAADELFAELGDYKDSYIQRATAQAAVQSHYDSIRLAEYDAACALLEEGSFLTARDAFIVMGDYSNSAEMANEALYRRAVLLYEFTEKYSMRGIYSCISDSADIDSVFYIAESSFADLGSAVSTELRDICRGDGVQINIQNPPAEGFIPICTDVSRLFEQLGSYKDSAEYVQKALELGDFTKPFYDMCAAGQLYDAYMWLEAYEDDFEARDAWMSVLQSYIPFCGVWELKEGDPTLIPMTAGVQAQCTNFVSAVEIIDYVLTMKIYINGNTDYPIELPLAAEGGRFSSNTDGVNTYIAALSNTGTFVYAKYSSYAITSQTNSCEYVRVG